MADWYVIHTLSGSEKKVKQSILDQVKKHNMSEYFKDVVVPVVEISEVKRGKNVKTERKFMPGYILIQMVMTDEAWHLVKSVPKISFLGNDSKPKPLAKSEVDRIFSQMESGHKGVGITSGYEVGEQVTVIDGPFDTFTGVIEAVDLEKNLLRVSISIFGKATPIDLNYNQVKKNN
jgi:transcriptional antiterminator NusG